MRKCGLLTLRPTEQNKSWTLVFLALTPLMRYLFLPPITTLESIRSFNSYSCTSSRSYTPTFNTNLSCHCNLVVCFKPKRTLAFVGVVKRDGHSGFGDTTLSVFVHQILEVGGSDLKAIQFTRVISRPLAHSTTKTH